MDFSRDELVRYSRQMIIPEFGEEGQRKLKQAKVLIAGAGGLGSPASYYLAAAGVGTLKIIDKDRVDLSNLNRQILHWTSDLDEWKSASGSRKLKNLNPHCSIEAVQAEITEENCAALAAGCSVIVDAMDNMGTRRLLNAASVKLGIPYIYGGVRQLDGMVTTFIPGRTPCLECVFPHRGQTQDAAQTPFPILGPVPGVIACIQAIEAIKLIAGIGELLNGRLLCFGGYEMSFREFKIAKDPECRVCGSRPPEGAVQAKSKS